MKRVKRRYFALQVESDCPFSDREVLDAIWFSLTRLYGEHGASLTNMVLISYDSERKIGVLRANLGVMDEVRASLASITSISGKAAAVHVIGVSGTIKALHANTKT